jgi:hypothetical protein
VGNRPHLEWLSSFIFLPVADIVAESLQDLSLAVELTRVGDIDVISTDCNSCFFFELAVGPLSISKRIGFAASVRTPMRVNCFGAVSSRSSPRLRDLCVEPISLPRAGRCNRELHKVALTHVGLRKSYNSRSGSSPNRGAYGLNPNQIRSTAGYQFL